MYVVPSFFSICARVSGNIQSQTRSRCRSYHHFGLSVAHSHPARRVRFVGPEVPALAHVRTAMAVSKVLGQQKKLSTFRPLLTGCRGGTCCCAPARVRCDQKRYPLGTSVCENLKPNCRAGNATIPKAQLRKSFLSSKALALLWNEGQCVYHTFGCSRHRWSTRLPNRSALETVLPTNLPLPL